MNAIYESNIEEFVIELLQKQGFKYLSPKINKNNLLLPKLMKGEIRVKEFGS